MFDFGFYFALCHSGAERRIFCNKLTNYAWRLLHGLEDSSLWEWQQGFEKIYYVAQLLGYNSAGLKIGASVLNILSKPYLHYSNPSPDFFA
jgi:hypothetical protein